MYWCTDQHEFPMPAVCVRIGALMKQPPTCRFVHRRYGRLRCDYDWLSRGSLHVNQSVTGNQSTTDIQWVHWSLYFGKPKIYHPSVRFLFPRRYICHFFHFYQIALSWPLNPVRQQLPTAITLRLSLGETVSPWVAYVSTSHLH